ncbi:chromate efflux transporter [Vibrio sp. SCSIO 43137]|uniref:chromate efflux transporter n=1 Tax=Vibrio sp. SCSIO 43137 TaxID=3021011 RepID=UPI00230832A9|nr:chromate efflux transporter [Vibrio sp. SCSIO 43137]WCE31488.1 chromate efflux transporter [Vibrio sp. SCSIO 43137]
MLSVFKIFFALGWVSFGGPAAHIGYFRKAFVEQRRWLDDDEYAQLIALSQFLPGPGSSQVGFALGYKKAGLGGAMMAFAGFTLPSVILMLLLALVSSQLTESSLFQGAVHGLKLMAVVVVADATYGMYKSFCAHRIGAALCIFSASALLLCSGVATQMLVLAASAVVGIAFLKGELVNSKQTFTPSLMPLLLFVGFLLLLPLISGSYAGLLLFNDFFQAGSLVFGGGHVVLPLLQSIVGDQLSQDTFLTGYAAAQAVPGPMFTFATYIGYSLLPGSPVVGAMLATAGVFLPGFLLLLTVLKNWHLLAEMPRVSGALKGVNAAVVGLLLAALYQPVFVSAVFSGLDFALALLGFYLLKQLKLPILSMVLFFALSGVVTGLFV